MSDPQEARVACIGLGAIGQTNGIRTREPRDRCRSRKTSMGVSIEGPTVARPDRADARAKDRVTLDVEEADGGSVDHLFTSSWLTSAGGAPFLKRWSAPAPRFSTKTGISITCAATKRLKTSLILWSLHNRATINTVWPRSGSKKFSSS